MKKVLLLSFVLWLGLSSCVTKKKYLALSADKTNMESFYLDSITSLRNDIELCADRENALSLDLAERKGENNILEKLREELQDQIDELELELELKSNQSVSSQKSTRQKINEKEAEIKALKAKLAGVEAVIQKYKDRLSAFIGDVSMAFQGYSDNMLNVSSRGDKAVVALSANSLLFKRPTSTSLSDRGKSTVQKMSEIIKRYPDLEIYVIGHTDNRPPAKSYKDNWYFSTLRAVTVVREMTQNNDVNNNQVYAVGKAEFAPVASNETSDGRAQNQRIEIVAVPLSRSMIREIHKITKG